MPTDFQLGCVQVPVASKYPETRDLSAPAFTVPAHS